jgi:hypothetical protein
MTRAQRRQARRDARARALASKYFKDVGMVEMPAVYGPPQPPPVESSPVPGWLLLGSAGLLAWWFLR